MRYWKITEGESTVIVLTNFAFTEFKVNGIKGEFIKLSTESTQYLLANYKEISEKDAMLEMI